MLPARMCTYFIRNLSNGPRGVIRLETILEERKVAGDLVKVFGVNFALSLCAAEGRDEPAVT